VDQAISKFRPEHTFSHNCFVRPESRCEGLRNGRNAGDKRIGLVRLLQVMLGFVAGSFLATSLLAIPTRACFGAFASTSSTLLSGAKNSWFLIHAVGSFKMTWTHSRTRIQSDSVQLEDLRTNDVQQLCSHIARGFSC